MKKKLLIGGVILLIIVTSLSIAIKLKPNHSMLSPSSQSYINKMVSNEMKDGHIPGVSVLIVKHNKVFMNKGYGYANIDKKTKVSPKTRFEIASNSKAFTGYAIMQLVKDNKIKLDDKISKYIPGFYMKYKGKKTDITVDQLIAQTSGIPGDITDNDKITKETDSLSGIVNSIKGRKLNAKPGKQFEYSNMNYDILGLIVQNVSHESYSNYMDKHIFKPLKMKDITTKDSNVKQADDAQGYLYKNGKYHADNPTFNIGDNPSAYMMTGTKGLESWIKFQLNPTPTYKSLISETHQPKVKTHDDINSSYATGWFVDDRNKDTIVYHPGTLENYSSYILLNPKQDYGIVILANSYSKSVPDLAQNLNTQMSNGKHIDTLQQFINQYQIGIVIITVLMCLLVVITLIFIWRYINQRKPIHFNWRNHNTQMKVLLLTVSFALILGLIHLLPSMILTDSDWHFMMSWLPTSAKYGLLSFVMLLTSLYAFLFFKIVSTTTKSN